MPAVGVEAPVLEAIDIVKELGSGAGKVRDIERAINKRLPRVTIPGKGTFTNVRFEARPEQWDRTSTTCSLTPLVWPPR